MIAKSFYYNLLNVFHNFSKLKEKLGINVNKKPWFTFLGKLQKLKHEKEHNFTMKNRGAMLKRLIVEVSAYRSTIPANGLCFVIKCFSL